MLSHLLPMHLVNTVTADVLASSHQQAQLWIWIYTSYFHSLVAAPTIFVNAFGPDDVIHNGSRSDKI